MRVRGNQTKFQGRLAINRHTEEEEQWSNKSGFEYSKAFVILDDLR